jgi:hypothetical protein
MKKLITILTVAVALFAVGCTQQSRARKWGGTANIELPPNKKLVNVAFKETDLWVLTRNAKEGEKPEVYELTESSSWGIIEGKVIIRER